WRVISRAHRAQNACRSGPWLPGGKQAIRGSHGRGGHEEARGACRRVNRIGTTSIVCLQSAHELRGRRVDQSRPGFLEAVDTNGAVVPHRGARLTLAPRSITSILRKGTPTSSECLQFLWAAEKHLL